MSDHDMIRRGDIMPAISAVAVDTFLLEVAIRALPAAPAPDVAGLVEAVVKACAKLDEQLDDANEFTALAWLDLRNAVTALTQIGGPHD